MAGAEALTPRDVSISLWQGLTGGLRTRNEALWPRMGLNPARGPGDLNLLGVDYFAEAKPDGGYELTRIRMG